MSSEFLGRTVVAMSGGVDSSVAALLLKEKGDDLVGVSMQVWDYRNHGGNQQRATCCAPSDFQDARRVAGKIGIPYYVMDLEQHFRDAVIAPFIRSYEEGTTPNPCIECNQKVKFAELKVRSQNFGCRAVATGHYAQIKEVEGVFGLYRSADREKDQTYFLYGLSQQDLRNTLFPIGHLTKPEVRELARVAGLVTAEKRESQDICFVSSSVKEFVERHGGKTPPPGLIRSINGAVVGKHEGFHGYTVGQRRGLQIGGTLEPLYVVELQTDTNTVVVGPRAALERESFKVANISWIGDGFASSSTIKALAQLRHRHNGVPVEISRTDDGCATVRFTSGWTTVTPGQAAVFYDLQNERVLGGGKISDVSLNSSRGETAQRPTSLAVVN